MSLLTNWFPSLRSLAGHLAVLVLFLGPLSASAQKLYVFFPSEVKPIVMQEKLGAQCSEATVTAFARYNDFAMMLRATPPDFIIAKPDLVAQLPDFSVVANGLNNGKKTEKYVIMGVDAQVKKSDITPETVLGLVDFLGRRKTISFARDLLGIETRISRVAKLEDLLPLLTFKQAKAVILAEREVQYFKQISNLKFVVSSIPDADVGIVVLAQKKGADGDAVIKAVKSFDAELNAILGVQKWN
ncbi:MAG: hypothetical protein GF344_09045 [Chitinivibrionales bacterium]|nr:hypothetical protein [Chitinivibrionales bacterium]MBD3357007.1 hypothetical protein [Chitinivibrionales bacterium]